MSPSEMRHEAERCRAEAGVLEESAATLRSAAASIRGLLASVPGMSRMVWQGPAATRFEGEAAQHSADLDEQADEIVREAAGFDSKAVGLREDANRLTQHAAQLEARRVSGTSISGAS